MKKILVLVLTAILFQSCFTSSVTVEDKNLMELRLSSIKGKYFNDDRSVYVQKVIDADGTKDELYVKLLEFVTRTYNDAQEVIQVKEKADGVIVCKGCHKFKVTDITIGSGREETAWHIYKAEVKDGKVRITLSIDEMESYYPGAYIPGAGTMSSVTIPQSRESYSILDCPPFKSYDDIVMQTRKGYIMYYSVANLLGLVDATEKALTEKTVYNTDDNW